MNTGSAATIVMKEEEEEEEERGKDKNADDGDNVSISHSTAISVSCTGIGFTSFVKLEISRLQILEQQKTIWITKKFQD